MQRSGIQFRFFIALLIIAIIPLVLLGMYGYKSSSELVERVELEKVSALHASLGNDIETFFTKSSADLEFMRSLVLLDWRENAHEYGDIEHFHFHMNDRLANFLKTHSYYDQVRILDASGMEIISVRNENNRILIQPDGQLQDQSGQYFFEKMQSLADGEHYITSIDLSSKNNVFEVPYKAIIRYITPVELRMTGEEAKRYYVMLSLNVSTVLEDLRVHIQSQDYNHTYLLNEEGEYLIHPVRQKEWGGKKNLDTGQSLHADTDGKRLWQDLDLENRVLTSMESESMLTKNEFIYWTPLFIEDLPGYRLYFLTVEASEDFMAPVLQYMQNYAILLLGVFVVLFIISSYISRGLSQPIRKIAKAVSNIGKGDFQTPLEIRGGYELEILAYEIKKMAFEIENSYKIMEDRVKERTLELQKAHDQMMEMANTDPLTGIFNRHYFNDYIETLKKEKRSINLALVMMDIDKFKYINDHYGHNIGDVVLVEVAKMLSSEIRDGDFVVRFGGDEFLIVLYNCQEDSVHAYLDRINAALKKWNKETDILEHDMVFSMGWDAYTEDRHIMEVLNNADERMYADKMARRKGREDGEKRT